MGAGKIPGKHFHYPVLPNSGRFGVFDMTEFHSLILDRFPWLCLSALPSHPSPSNKHQF